VGVETGIVAAIVDGIGVAMAAGLVASPPQPTSKIVLTTTNKADVTTMRGMVIHGIRAVNLEGYPKTC
jgi:hypothetical protein